MNFYNEFDPHAAAWLRELIASKLIPAGVVDERSITEIQPHELTGYTQCHFFCGIAGWSLALKLAGVDSTRPLWTGSCPCQPYSTAGKGLGDDDPRNLWPAFFKLIRECRPELVFGEQVADAIGKGWLDGISADLEGKGYACGAAVLGAHSVNAPHIRKRLYWVADAKGEQSHGGGDAGRGRGESSDGGDVRRMADSERPRIQGHAGDERDGNQPGRIDPHATGSTAEGGATGGGVGNPESRGLGIVGNEAQPGSCGHVDGSGESCRVDNPTSPRLGRTEQDTEGNSRDQARLRVSGEGCGEGHWSDSRWIYCRDGKHRRIPTEPALFPLADGLPYKLARRGSIRPALLKGAGNAIVPQTAAQFIQAFLTL